MSNITKSKTTLASQIDQQISTQAQAVAKQALIRHTFITAVHRHLVAKNLLADGAASVARVAAEMERATDEAARLALTAACEKAGISGGIPDTCTIELSDAHLKAFLTTAAEHVVAAHERSARK